MTSWLTNFSVRFGQIIQAQLGDELLVMPHNWAPKNCQHQDHGFQTVVFLVILRDQLAATTKWLSLGKVRLYSTNTCVTTTAHFPRLHKHSLRFLALMWLHWQLKFATRSYLPSSERHCLVESGILFPLKATPFCASVPYYSTKCAVLDAVHQNYMLSNSKKPGGNRENTQSGLYPTSTFSMPIPICPNEPEPCSTPAVVKTSQT